MTEGVISTKGLCKAGLKRVFGSHPSYITWSTVRTRSTQIEIRFKRIRGYYTDIFYYTTSAKSAPRGMLPCQTELVRVLKDVYSYLIEGGCISAGGVFSLYSTKCSAA